MKPDSRHQCLIYEGSPSKKLGLLASILIRKMEEGYRCLYLNSPPMVAGMGSTLASMGIDVVAEIEKRRLVLSSEPASSNEEFNIDMMLKKLEDSLDEAIKDGYKGLWASGDMTWEFGAMQDFSRLMEYECKLEALFHKRKELCGVCQYHHDTLPKDAIRQGVLIHPTLVINETLTIINPHYLKSTWPTDETSIQKLDEMIASLSREQN